MLFDEVAFEDEGLEFRVNDHDLDVADFADEAGDAQAVAGAGLKVLPNACSERNGLADVQNLPVFIEHAINTGQVRQVFQKYR